jgi:hypothetical protein
MTAPRIVPAAEAEALYLHGTDEELAAIAPDLATSVVALHAEVERARRFERIRVAEWMRTKIKAGLLAAEFADDPQARAFFLGLIAYANAIDANRMDP